MRSVQVKKLMDAALAYLRERAVHFTNWQQMLSICRRAVTNTPIRRNADQPTTTRIASVRSGGFTLIELIITMILIGILSAAVMTNINAMAQHSVTTQADQLRRNLSHIQLLAISQGKRLRLTADTTSYTVTSCAISSCSGTNPVVTDPTTGLPFIVPLTDGVTLSDSTLDFDSLGRPQLDGSLITDNPARTYTLSGSGNCVDVSVLPITGFANTALPRTC